MKKLDKSNFENLLVWQKSVDISAEIYTITENFPKSEIFGLTNQMRRCFVSIPSNIAEWAEKQSKKEFAQFLSIAIGSTSELKTQLIISKKVGFLLENNFNNLMIKISEIHKMLNGLRLSIKNASNIKLSTSN